MARLKDIVVDSRHPASIARFWAEVLDGYVVAPYTAEEVARLRAAGVEDLQDDPTVLVVRTDGGGPRLFFQRVPEAKSVKNRLHLDLAAADLGSEVARLERLGARVAARHDGWITLLDPEGNEFCVAVAAH